MTWGSSSVDWMPGGGAQTYGSSCSVRPSIGRSAGPGKSGSVQSSGTRSVSVMYFTYENQVLRVRYGLAKPCAQKSHTSSAVMGFAAPSSDSPLDWATNMTVCIVMAAIRLTLTSGRNSPAALASSINSVSRASNGACATFTSDGCETNNRGAKSVNSGRLAVGSGREVSNSSLTATFNRSSGSE